MRRRRSSFGRRWRRGRRMRIRIRGRGLLRMGRRSMVGVDSSSSRRRWVAEEEGGVRGLGGCFRVIEVRRRSSRVRRRVLSHRGEWRLMRHLRLRSPVRRGVGRVLRELILRIRRCRRCWRICCRWVLRRIRLRSMRVSSRAIWSRTKLRLQRRRRRRRERPRLPLPLLRQRV